MMYEKSGHTVALDLSRKFTLVQSLPVCVSVPVLVSFQAQPGAAWNPNLLFHRKLLFLASIQHIGRNSVDVDSFVEVSEVHATSIFRI
jgi:hypothetical protein